MGVRGFTTYMAQHSHRFHQNFQLKNCYIIIDGSGVAINLYVWHTKSNDCFGGDYNKYANTVYKFFNLLKTCNVTPIILFDGCYEKRKLRTVYKRMKNRIGSIKRLNSSTEKDIKVFPLFTREIFEDIAVSLGLKCIRNDHESDSEIACLGRCLHCPILGYDSDFYFFDAPYIPFNKFEMKSVSYFDDESKTNQNYIPCQVYNIDHFLAYFGGLDKINLPLLPVLLGNDYVKKSLFSAFYKHIKLKKSKSLNEQQRLIKTVINWLQHETLESAISKILGRFKKKNRRFIYFKLKGAMKGYQQVDSTIIDYLKDIDITFHDEEVCNIDIENIEPTYDVEPQENISNPMDEEVTSESNEDKNSESNEDKNSESNDESDENDDELTQICPNNKRKNPLNEELYFTDRYRKCNLPRSFGDIKYRNTYFCIPQVENYADPNSHRISLNIISCIHKILTSSSKAPFYCVLRSEDSSVKKELLEEYCGDVPALANIPDLSESDRKRCLLEILKIDEIFEEFLNMFPSTWHMYLISLYYWKKNSTKTIDITYIYSLIICAIILNFVYPSSGKSINIIDKQFYDQKRNNPRSKHFVPSKSIEALFRQIDFKESISCLKSFINFFKIQPKKPIDKRLSEATIVGYFSEFQSCALHIKFLNSLLCFPFDDLMFSQFFNGTFLYNSVVDFRRRSNLKSYLELLLKDCDFLLYSLKQTMTYIDQYFGGLCESSAKKLRKRRKNRNKGDRNEDLDS